MNSSKSSRTASLMTISIMGIRGVPASHGGFETFAEKLAPFLVAEGWAVTVYCQENDTQPVRESNWQGVRRVHIGAGGSTALSTIRFDWACISHAIREKPQMVLTLGYNTAAFGLRLRAAGIPNVMNMDGIEWSRKKWGPMARAWLYVNDWAGCIGATHLVADHPEIARHLKSRVAARKITVIPYGATPTDEAGTRPLQALGLEAGRFVTVIARPEPENSILEIVKAFSSRPRGVTLAVLGNLLPDSVPYHASLIAHASNEVRFLGAIYDPLIVQAVRRHCLLYVHGHRVGGTNPSLLEAMGAGNPVLAHDNRFNRWVAADGAVYFNDADACSAALDRLLDNVDLRNTLARANLERARDTFAWLDVLVAYASLLTEVHRLVHGRPTWPHLSSALTHEPHGHH